MIDDGRPVSPLKSPGQVTAINKHKNGSGLTSNGRFKDAPETAPCP